MGENEEGGMLRTVVVLGLVAIIASTLISGIKVLKGQMSSLSTQATNMVGTTLTTPSPIDQINQHLQLNANQVDGSNAYGDATSTPDKWSISSNGYEGAVNYLGQDDQGQPAVLSQGWLFTYSPVITIPDGAKTMTVNFRAFASTQSIMFSAAALSEKAYGGNYTVYGGKGYTIRAYNQPIDPSWQNYSFNVDLKAADGTYNKTNRQTQFEFTDTDYDHPTGTATAGVSQIKVSFS